MRHVLIATALAATALVGIPVIAQNAPSLGTPDVSRVVAGNYTVDPAHTQILFEVNHLGFSQYFGIFGDATGTMTLDPAKPEAATVSIDIPIAKMVTTSADLTAHLLRDDFFDAAKFPTATFRSTSVTVSGTTAKIAGNLTIRGITKPIVLDARFVGAGSHPMTGAPALGFAATAKVKRSDFGVSYGIPMVPDEVDLRINVAFDGKK
ncbi:MAG TPA: YceI family protein [Sphingomonadaceae bacterium]|nr:YceI family protein [Sphingomonadaceae bacterium]